ncbi:hypothetical protein K438DRAFT_1779067 [Mycena galopus ATCC 62051]|nr:hypothetical protein K438DRAFT_1779067 [Mycena galopus ATCC 62051]
MVLEGIATLLLQKLSQAPVNKLAEPFCHCAKGPMQNTKQAVEKLVELLLRTLDRTNLQSGILDSIKCLWDNHKTKNVQDMVTIAQRKTSATDRCPHRTNESGMSRKNWGCVQCQHNRNELGCKHPGNCIVAATHFIETIRPKLNPLCQNLDLCDELGTYDDNYAQEQPETNYIILNANFQLKEISHGFQIFSQESDTVMQQIPAKRYETSLPVDKMTVYIYTVIIDPGTRDVIFKTMIMDEEKKTLNTAH